MKKLSRHLPHLTRRDAWLEINLQALEHNARLLRQALPEPISLMAIVKADAYGHGAVMCVPTLVASGVGMLGVAAMDEAIQLREAGVEVPILVIGAIPDWAMAVAADYDIQLTVFALHHLESLRKLPVNRQVAVHIKVDTGMHRIGVDYTQTADLLKAVMQIKNIKLAGLFTHLACAGDLAVTALQRARWQMVLQQARHVLPAETFNALLLHVANSTGALCYPTALNDDFNMVRMGIAFYGYNPEAATMPAEVCRLQADALRPVMGLKARVVHVQTLLPGEGVSYGHTFQVPIQGSARTLATLPLGYADGIPRGLSNKLVGQLRGQPVAQVGNITMDQLMVDVTDVVDVQVGDTVSLLDETHTLTAWAKTLGTIEYELMCGLRVRLPKIYTRQ